MSAEAPGPARTRGDVTVRLAVPADAQQIARLHMLIAEGFLSSLGPRFLSRLYGAMARSDHSFVVVAEVGGEVVGFIGVTTDTSRLYRSFLRSDGIVAAMWAAPRLLWHWRATLETLRYNSEAHGEDIPAAELLSAAVAPAGRGKGMGRAVSQGAIAELRRRGVPGVRAVIAANNEPSLSLYRSLGLQDVAQVEVHRGAPSVMLVMGLTET